MGTKYVSDWKAVCPKCDKEYNSKKENYICTNCEKGFVKANFEGGEGRDSYLGCNRCEHIDVHYQDCECGANFRHQIRKVKSYWVLYLIILTISGSYLYGKASSFFQNNDTSQNVRMIEQSAEQQPQQPPQVIPSQDAERVNGSDNTITDKPQQQSSQPDQQPNSPIIDKP